MRKLDFVSKPTFGVIRQAGIAALALLSVACSPPENKKAEVWASSKVCGRPVKILALGDAVVAGMHLTNVAFGGTSGAFRTLLWKRLQAAGIQAEMVGGRCSGPPAYAAEPQIESDDLCKGFAPQEGAPVDRVRSHQGLAGWKLRDLLDGTGPALVPPVRGNLASWVQEAAPDVLILMPGPADLSRQNGARKAFAESIANGPTVELIDRVRALAPAAHIVVANHPPVGRPGQGSDGALQVVKWFNDQLVNVQTDLYAGGTGQVKFVDVFSRLERSVDVSADPAYPSASGYERIAAALEERLVPLLTCP